MKTNITANDVRKAIACAAEAHKTLDAALYGDGQARRSVRYCKDQLEWEYAHDRDPEKIAQLVAELAKAEADVNATHGRRESGDVIDRLCNASELAAMRADTYKRAYLMQCAAVIERALKNDETLIGMHCHWKRTKENMQAIVDNAVKDLDGIKAKYCGLKNLYYRDYPAKYDAYVSVQWEGDYSSNANVRISLISYCDNDAIAMPKEPLSAGVMASATTQDIDNEIRSYARAKKEIATIRRSYIAQCEAITNQFDILGTSDLSERASVGRYDIR